MNSLRQVLQQRLLLQLEYNTEKQAFQKQTETIGLQRKVKRGDAWFPLRIGRSYYNSLNQMCIEVFRVADEETEHNFEFGRPVSFFVCNAENAIKHLSFTGQVSYVDGDRMVVSVPDSAPAELAQHDNIGVQLFFDETSYRLMFDALDRVMRARGNRLAYLRDLFYTKGMAPEKFRFQPMHFPWLNKTQESAVNEVLWAKDVMVVHGPPGTGKTTTLVEAISETLRRESQVMVCAQSNMAVDWISEQLVDRGINVLRIGNPTRVNDKMLSFTYERRFEAHPDYPQLWSLRKAIREMRSKRKRGNESYHQQLDRLKSRATELEVRINQELFTEARAIASTLTGSANRVLEGQKFTTLFIDEAAQALEAACWIPMRKVSRVIFAGDHCQLPPTVKNPECLRAGLGKTLMELVAEQKPACVRLLTVQYRMNETLMRFSSDWFYDGRLTAADSVRYRSILEETDYPLVWIETSPNPSKGGEHETAQSPQEVGETISPPPLEGQGEVVSDSSIYNKEEAEYAIAALHLYIEKIGKHRVQNERIDFGVISPYKAQVHLLRQLVKKDSFLRPYRRSITINTVDAFQGQERDVIVLSTVRANESGKIGFLSDLRRMNVAITRARYKVIIVGDASTLCRHRFYRELHNRCKVIG